MKLLTKRVNTRYDQIRVEDELAEYKLNKQRRNKMTEEEQLEQTLEQTLVNKGLDAPHVTPEMIDESIVGEEYHVFDSTSLTVCLLTLKNGYNVTGYSACVSPENFDARTGEEISKRNARDQIWTLLGFSLAEQISNNPCVPKISCGGCK